MHPYQRAVEAAVKAAAEAKDSGRALGAGSCMASGDAGADLRRDNGSVEYLIPKSPRLALARALNIDMVPYPFTITCNFSAAGNNQTLTDQGPNRTISRDVLLYGIDVDIQVPTAFTGDELKPVSDFFFDYTSGIQAAINIYGKDRRRMAYAPLRAINKYCSPDEPWVVSEEQIPSMDFTTTTALPFAGTTITVTFIGKTPAVDTVYRMSPSDAYDGLAKLGYCVDTARAVWGA
jgi:hypothetical protein